MKQVVQNLRSGVTELMDVPAPKVSRGHLLLQTRATLISAGTERSLVEFGKASLINKARQNPERVKQVLAKIKTDGFLPTLDAVRQKLDEPLALGYCHAGVVHEVGADVTGYSIGDRIASNAPHAMFVNQPVNLTAKIPNGVSDEEAAFTPLAAIALQGTRLLEPQIGETIVVFGLGLVGLMAVQILLAQGVRVLAIDLDSARLRIAGDFGAEAMSAGDEGDIVAAARALTGGHGVDGVLIAAAAKNDSIISQSAQMCRKRGRIVLVGTAEMQLDRGDFYEKELTFQVSCSYGPGRHDEVYEQHGVDYPYAFVRFTEQRNFETVLSLMARGKLDVQPLITMRMPHSEAAKAYELLANDRTQLGIIFEYPTDAQPDRTIATPIALRRKSMSSGVGHAHVGVIGAGTFTTRALLPALAKTPAKLVAIASAGGLSAAHAARKFGFEGSTTDYRAILANDEINTVFITTRNHMHASMAAEALSAGKHVFVEKPLAIDEEGLEMVRAAHAEAADRHLMVGYNRRFAPHAVRMRELLATRQAPLCANVLVNAGYLPAENWAHDLRVGGGRMVAEGCHWVDLMRFLVGAPISNVQSSRIGDAPGVETRDDHASALVSFADGSIATIHYFANGHRTFPKERIEVFCQGRVLELDNFRVLRGYGWKNFRKMRLFRQDKGHAAEIAQFIDRVARGGPPLIEPAELWNVCAATIAAQRADTSRGLRESGPC